MVTFVQKSIVQIANQTRNAFLLTKVIVLEMQTHLHAEDIQALHLQRKPLAINVA